MIRALAMAGLAVASFATGASRAETSAEQPYVLIRQLQLLQDEVVKGNKPAVDQKKPLLDRIARVITASPPAAWQDERNVRSIALYLVEGGLPAPVHQVLDRSPKLGELEKPIRALLAFSEQRKEAKALLAELGAMNMPPAVGAPLALAQGIDSWSDPHKAMRYLKIAQLLAPGTLIDEAATRREISLLLAEKKSAEAISRAGRFLWRFGSSVYAEHVVTYLTQEVLPHLPTDDAGQVALQAFLDAVPPGSQVPLLLDVARTSILNGKLAQVANVSRRAITASVGEPAAEQRASLYASIARALSKDAEPPADDFARFDRSLLSDTDIGILDAAAAISDRVRRSPIAGEAQFDPAKDAPRVAMMAFKVLTIADEQLAEHAP